MNKVNSMLPDGYITLGENESIVSPITFKKKEYSDRAPEILGETKLFGRQKELGKLLKCFEEVNRNDFSQLCLIGGPSGSGKSALADAMRSHVTSSEYNGFFCAGKFEQKFESNLVNVPFSALATAFSEGIEYVLNIEDEDEIVRRREIVKNALGADIVTFARFITNLTQLTGTSLNEDDFFETQEKRKSMMANNHIPNLFRNFLQSLARKESPVLLFLDDLQWADKDSISIFRAIATDKTIKHVLLVGAYRSDEVSSSSLLPLDSKQIACKKSEIIIENFGLQGIKELMRGKLNIDNQTEIDQLANVVLQKSGGNAFHAIQFLFLIYKKHLLQFDSASRRWLWQINLIIEKTDISDNLLALVTERIGCLPGNIKSMMILMAFLGYSFEVEILSVIVNDFERLQNCGILPHQIRKITKNEIEDTIQRAVKDCLLEKYSSKCYKFTHDQIQKAFYGMIESQQMRSELHYSIGNSLAKTPDLISSNKLFLAVNQLNQGTGKEITEEERISCARLNFDAGKCSVSHLASSSACEYFRSAADLLKHDMYWTSDYYLMIDLYSSLAEMEARTLNIESSRKISHAVLSRAQNIDDKLRAMVTLVESYVVKSTDDALDVGVHLLNLLGRKIPRKPTMMHVLVTLLRTKVQLRKKTDYDILNLPPLTDPKIIAVIDIMNYILMATFLSEKKRELAALVSLQTIQLTLKYGLCKLSSICFGNFAFALAYFGDRAGASRYGHLAASLQEKVSASESEAKVIVLLTNFVYVWEKPLNTCVDLCYSGLSIGKKACCLEDAYLCGTCAIYYLFHSGQNLFDLLSRIRAMACELDQFEISNAKQLFPFFQIVENLTGVNGNTTKLSGAFIDEDRVLPILKGSNQTTGIVLYYFARIIGAVIFNYWSLAAETASMLKKSIAARRGHGSELLCQLFLALAYIESYHHGFSSKRSNMEQLRKIIRKLNKWITKQKVINIRPQFLLLKAELALLSSRRKVEGESFLVGFKDAITASKDGNLIHYEALFNERASVACIRQEKYDLAEKFIDEAKRCYQIWGAYAKVEAMEKQNSIINLVHFCRND